MNKWNKLFDAKQIPNINKELSDIEGTPTGVSDGIQIAGEIKGYNSQTLFDENVASVEEVPFELWVPTAPGGNYDYSPYAQYVSSSKPCNEIIISVGFSNVGFIVAMGLEHRIPHSFSKLNHYFILNGAMHLFVTSNMGVSMNPMQSSIKLPRKRWGITLMPWVAPAQAGYITGCVTFINNQLEDFSHYRKSEG